MMRTPVIVVASIVFCCVLKVMAQAPSAGQTPVDVKGWHGAEWGMTVEQVSAALAVHLEPRTLEPLDKDPTAHAFTSPITVGDWHGKVAVLFDGAGKLYWIRITLTGVAWRIVRDELSNKYGTPTSDTGEALRGEIQTKEARWLLPVTLIRCHETTFAGESSGVNVWYELRKANPL